MKKLELVYRKLSNPACMTAHLEEELDVPATLQAIIDHLNETRQNQHHKLYRKP